MSGRGPVLENRLPAEGINSSDEHPMREFAWLVGASGVTLVVLMLLVGWGAQWMAPRLPFAAEIALAERLVDRPAKPEQAARSAALQALAERIGAKMGLPDGMAVVVAYDESPVVNAYATVGGRIRVFRGLLQRLKSEDALAALLAHEIAHVKRRHVAANLGRGLALSLLLGVVSSDAGAAAAEAAIGNAAGLALLGYSRVQEAQADDDALRALVALYGHAGGLLELFTTLGPAAADTRPAFELLRTHPLTQARIDAARKQVQGAGWRVQGPLTAMPPALVLPADAR